MSCEKERTITVNFSRCEAIFQCSVCGKTEATFFNGEKLVTPMHVQNDALVCKECFRNEQ